MHTEYQDRQPRPDLPQLFQDLQPASISQREVEYPNIPILFADEPESFADGACFTEDHFFGLFTEYLLDAVANDLMVIYYEDLFHFFRQRTLSVEILIVRISAPAQ